jgi:hypothetical protein
MASGIATTDSMVNGETARMVIDGLGELKKKTRHILSEYGLERPRPDQWYSHEDLVKLLAEVAVHGGTFTLYNAGAYVAGAMSFPPQVDSMGQALRWLGSAYETAHRGEESGAYTIEETENGSVTVISSSLYPCDFDRGLIEATARRFRPEQLRRVSLMHYESSPCRKTGDRFCAYSIKW